MLVFAFTVTRPTGFGWTGTGSPALSPVPPPTAKSLGVTISARFCVLGGQNEEKRSNRSNLLAESGPRMDKQR